ncbi:MAG: hypothetical protein ACYDBX_04325 [Patescibacteria group bacterium]
MKTFVLFLLILLSGLAYSQTTTLDYANNLNSGLSADSVWNGKYVDLIARNTASITLFVYSDSASATNGLKIYFSPDGITARDSLAYSVPADSAVTLLFVSTMRYYRIQYTNGTKVTHITIIQPILRTEGDY